MKIKELPLSSLIPYTNNPRLNDEAVDAVANSIREFGFKVPIVIDKDRVIVTGHTRAKAAESLGMDTVPCIVADDLTPEQIKAYRLADNKVAELAAWDFSKLEEELADLEIDMEAFGFELDDVKFEDEDNGYFGAERERTIDAYNLKDFDSERTVGFYEMPLIKAEHHVPKDLISFNYVLSKDAFDKGVHFYIDDYQFERIWNNPTEYMDRLAQFDCCLTPDFSLYTQMPIAMQIWNVYRSRLVGQIMQDNGIKVIPTLSWCRENSFQFCFDGIEPGGVVSVSTIGVKQDPEAKKLWENGMREALRRLKPECVIVYGGDIGFDFGKVKTIYINNHNSDNFRKSEATQGAEKSAI
ncbi:MAG: DUF4417 domain-containing protein [Bacteroidales bacterium]|nr:DUF4417 domain-containing protein [Candidatus Equimonas faecalis]